MIALKRRNVVFRAVREPNLMRGALRLMRRLLALRQVLPWKLRQVCSMSVLYFGKYATIHYELCSPASEGPCFSTAGDFSTEAEVRHKRRRKQEVITRHLVPFSGQEPGPVDVGSHERSRVMLEQAFDGGNIEMKRGYRRFGSLWVPHLLNCLDHFAVDPAITPVRATGHRLVTLCRSVCAEKKSQILDPLMGSKCPTMCCYSFYVSSLHCIFLFTELVAILQQLGQSAARPGPHVADTNDSSANESEASHSRRRVRSKRIVKMKKVWGANEVGKFFVTGATDAAGKPSHFYCRVCRKDVSVLTHGPHEILRHYQGVKHFACDQRLRLETPGWRVLDLEGKPLSESELERQKEHILRGHLVVRDREFPYAEDLIVDESGALVATLPVVAKVSSLIEVVRLGGPYELVSQLWRQFTQITIRVNIDVAWSRDEVLVGIVLLLVATCTCSLALWCCVLVAHLEWNVPPHSC